MKNKKETVKEIIVSMRQNRILSNEYINPSMIEKKPSEIGIKCEEVTYVVEWQMRHQLRDEIPSFKYTRG